MTAKERERLNQQAIAIAQQLGRPLTLAIGQGYDPYLYDETKPAERKFDLYLDIRAYLGVDIVAAWQTAKLPSGAFNLIHSSQTLEHLSLAEQKRALQNCYNWLVEGGSIDIWTPDIITQAKWAAEGKITWDWLLVLMNGELDYPENEHRYLHSQESLIKLAESAGFSVQSCEPVIGSFQLLATKP